MHRNQRSQQCCNGDGDAAVPLASLVPKPFLKASNDVTRRAKLIDLNPHFHCSVVGTCLSTTELRRLVPRFKQVERHGSSDADIHHAAVELAGQPGPGSKALNRALDERYDLTLRRYRQFKSEEELIQGWEQSLTQGDIPGAYWASLTHPCSSSDFRRRIFGEVHMLSHLVGASNRADIRRLILLEEENARLKDRLAQLHLKLQIAHQSRQDAQFERHRLTAAVQAVKARAGQTLAVEELQSEIDQLKTLLTEKDTALMRQTLRREAEESRIGELSAALVQETQRTRIAMSSIEELKGELKAQQIKFEDDVLAELGKALQGRRILYVGGRPSAVQAIRALVERSGGEFLTHGGSTEHRRALLGSLVGASDLVVFPVDCIDHDSVGTLKRECERHQITYYPLRTSSVTAFIGLLTRLAKTQEFHLSAV